MSKKLDQIRKLIATANDAPHTPEGQTARKIANRKLKKLGLTDADVMLEARKLLDKRRHAWDAALLDVVSSAYAVELRQRIDTNEETDDLVVHGPSTVVDQVEFRFVSLRRALLKRSGDYHRSISMLVPIGQINELVNEFLNYAVIALSERLILEEEEEVEATEELEMIEDKNPDASVENGGDEIDGEVAEDLLDKLIAETDNEVEHELPSGLDPALCGYRAGHEVPLTDALTEKAVEEAKQLVNRAGFLTEDQTKGLEDDFSKWEDLF